MRKNGASVRYPVDVEIVVFEIPSKNSISASDLHNKFQFNANSIEIWSIFE